MDRHLKKKKKKPSAFADLLKLACRKNIAYFMSVLSLKKKKAVWEELKYGCVIQYLI